jgi:hypothetical protein
MSSQDNRDNSSANSGAVNRRDILLASTSVAVASALGSTALMQITQAQAQTAQGGAETPITEQEAYAIGVNAYLYFYPLITMDVTRKQSTNIEPGKEIAKGPMNMFVSVPTYPPADLKVVVRPNFDTLYSLAWLDLTKQPMIVSAPTRMVATISCRCSTCGPMCSPHPAGVPRVRRLETSSSLLPVGPGTLPRE